MSAGLYKELQEQKNEPVYHVAHTPPHVTYGNQNQTSRSLPDSTPRPIQFVNGGLGSRSNSPGNTLEGRTNPAFLSETTLNVSQR